MYVHSIQDVQRILEDPSIASKVQKLVENPIYYGSKIQRLDLEVGGLFKRAYCGSKGHPSCATIQPVIPLFLDSLKQAETACQETQSHLLQALQCHDVAMNHYQRNEEDQAMCAMSKTNQSATCLHEQYERLGKSFSSLRKELVKVFSLLNRDLTNFRVRKREEPNSSVLDITIQGLQNAVKAAWGFQTAALNAEYGWKTLQKEVDKLQESPLGDKERIECLKMVAESNMTNGDFYDLCMKRGSDRPATEEELQAAVASLQENEISASISRAVDGLLDPNIQKRREMGLPHTPIKSGRLKPVQIDNKQKEKDDFVELMEMGCPSSINQAFENSRLQWLTLAQQHFLMGSILSKAISNVTEVQKEIEKLEKNFQSK